MWQTKKTSIYLLILAFEWDTRYFTFVIYSHVSAQILSNGKGKDHIKVWGHGSLPDIAIAYSLYQNHELYDTLLYKQNIDNFNIDIFLIITSAGGFSTLLEIPRHPIDELYPHCLLVILCLSEYFQSSSVTSSCFNWKQK